MSHRPVPPDPREWDAQEQGRRLGTAGRVEDADVAAYRHIATALRTQPLPAPPADFAALVAAAAAREDRGLERRLSRALLSVFALAGVAVVARYGLQWWQPLAQGIGSDALGWLLAAAGCIGSSWLLRRALAGAPQRPPSPAGTRR